MHHELHLQIKEGRKCWVYISFRLYLPLLKVAPVPGLWTHMSPVSGSRTAREKSISSPPGSFVLSSWSSPLTSWPTISPNKLVTITNTLNIFTPITEIFIASKILYFFVTILLLFVIVSIWACVSDCKNLEKGYMHILCDCVLPAML